LDEIRLVAGAGRRGVGWAFSAGLLDPGFPLRPGTLETSRLRDARLPPRPADRLPEGRAGQVREAPRACQPGGPRLRSIGQGRPGGAGPVAETAARRLAARGAAVRRGR